MEEKTVIQEKRIQSTIIRRRKATVEEPKAAPVEATVSVVTKEAEQPEVTENAATRKRTSKKNEEQVETTPVEVEAAMQNVAAVEQVEPAIVPQEVAATKSESSVVTKGAATETMDPRMLPGGPPVGSIIKLPHMLQKEKAQEEAKKQSGLVDRAVVKTPKQIEEEADDALKKAKAAKRKPVLKDIGGDISEYGNVSQIRNVFLQQQDRVFQPVRSMRVGKKKTKVREGNKTLVTVPKASKRVLEIHDQIQVGELAHQMGVKSAEIIKILMKMGTMATVTQNIDYDTAYLIGQELGWEIKKGVQEEQKILSAVIQEDKAEDLLPRAPIVTVMGHVDHGKTSLLDKIRNSKVAAGEAGGITQHIGAYRVKTSRGNVTFIDTPGHEAFTAMRARGASITDLVILVVAADDGAMPQTMEAIDHAQAANVPIIVAVNKIDKPEANPDKVKRELSEKNLVPEEWGGTTMFVNVSAKTGQGIEDLLERIILQSEVLELKSNPSKLAKGFIIESRLDKSRGPLATVLIKEGSLKVGDPIVVGLCHGKVKMMLDDQGNEVKVAEPSMAVELLGLSEVPSAGEQLQALNDEKDVKLISEQRAIKAREVRLASGQKISLEDIYSQLKTGEVFELRMVIKGDVQGSVEAVRDAFNRLSTDRVKVKVLHTGVGGITESDIMLASASNALVIGFNVRPEIKAIDLAKKEGIEIQVFSIIYEAIDTVKKAMQGLLPKIIKEKYLGRAEVRQVFTVSKVGKVAGCYVIDGLLRRNAHIRILRDNVILYEGTLSTLKRFKDDAREVEKGFECGLGVHGYADLKEGDVIESFTKEEEIAEL